MFPGAFIWCGGFKDRERAQASLDTGLVDLIAFDRPYIANPDLVERLNTAGRWPKRTDQLTTPDAARWVTRTSLLIPSVVLHAARPDRGSGSSGRSVPGGSADPCWPTTKPDPTLRRV